MSWLNDLPHDLAAALKFETRGEVIRWAARPGARSTVLASLGIYVIAIPWLLISAPICAAMLGAILKGPPASRAVAAFELAMTYFGFLFTLVFVLVGIVMLLVPVWALRRAQRMVFAVTDRRILTIVEGKSRKVTTVLPDKVLKLERKEGRDGHGTLKITIGHEKDSDGDTVAKAESIYGVPRVAEAERLVRELIARQRPPAAA